VPAATPGRFSYTSASSARSRHGRPGNRECLAPPIMILAATSCGRALSTALARGFGLCRWCSTEYLSSLRLILVEMRRAEESIFCCTIRVSRYPAARCGKGAVP